MPELKRITETEMRDLLREADSRDPEASLLAQVTRSLCDPASGIDENRRFRIHPLYLTLCLILFFAFCVFLYFSFVRL